ncbi:guanine nucleotide-binding protein G(I)/G(S)/G(O) subunit gamma-5-like [Scyliorhinus canicula]|uniref:guanine nucleotide-binding protein G(I)/G(S)/G(O) subunit gamma-5-like n=1 Tax=Scyliorhinus canicula TaxID=7830 RepID=UPI0018F43700|nr:guanine nucleotide-binding protein G(I)/G(S)/G(O) subunit gamma-5-like [Scyliorhinus canicula]
MVSGIVWAVILVATNLSASRKMVQLLRCELDIKRLKVSQAETDLEQFCLQNAQHDPLLTGILPNTSPFRPAKPCSLL